MKLPSEIFANLYSLFNPRIYYDKENKQYLLNNNWINEIDDSYFEVGWNNIKIDILKLFKNGLDEKEFLKKLLSELNDIKIKNPTHDKYDFDSIEKWSPSIVSRDKFNISKPLRDKLKFDYFTKLYKERTEYDEIINSDYYHFLFIYFKFNKGLKNRSSFLKLRLLYVLNMRNNVLNDACSLFEEIEENYTNFQFNLSNLYDTFMDVEIKNNKIKCNISLNKTDTAKLITFLIEEKIFYVGDDETKSKLLTERFFEENFNYKFGLKQFKAIDEINKETSDIRNSKSELDKEKYLNFLESLIGRINLQKEKYQKKK